MKKDFYKKCCLCPSREGTLKPTDTGGWAHVVCALYIQEVSFGDMSALEPIIVTNVPKERFKQTCSICTERQQTHLAGLGACMSCSKSGCKSAFHVTCAQEKGFLFEEHVNNNSLNNNNIDGPDASASVGGGLTPQTNGEKSATSTTPNSNATSLNGASGNVTVNYRGYCALHITKLRNSGKIQRTNVSLKTILGPEVQRPLQVTSQNVLSPTGLKNKATAAASNEFAFSNKRRLHSNSSGGSNSHLDSIDEPATLNQSVNSVAAAAGVSVNPIQTSSSLTSTTRKGILTCTPTPTSLLHSAAGPSSCDIVVSSSSQQQHQPTVFDSLIVKSQQHNYNSSARLPPSVVSTGAHLALSAVPTSSMVSQLGGSVSSASSSSNSQSASEKHVNCSVSSSSSQLHQIALLNNTSSTGSKGTGAHVAFPNLNSNGFLRVASSADNSNSSNLPLTASNGEVFPPYTLNSGPNKNMPLANRSQNNVSANMGMSTSYNQSLSTSSNNRSNLHSKTHSKQEKAGLWSQGRKNDKQIPNGTLSSDASSVGTPPPQKKQRVKMRKNAAVAASQPPQSNVANPPNSSQLSPFAAMEATQPQHPMGNKRTKQMANSTNHSNGNNNVFLESPVRAGNDDGSSILTSGSPCANSSNTCAVSPGAFSYPNNQNLLTMNGGIVKPVNTILSPLLSTGSHSPMSTSDVFPNTAKKDKILMIENKGIESWSQDQFLHAASSKYTAVPVSNLKPERCNSSTNNAANGNNTLIHLQSSDLCDQYRYGTNQNALLHHSNVPLDASTGTTATGDNLGQHKMTTSARGSSSGGNSCSNGMRVTSNNSSGGHSLTSMVSLLEEQWNQGSQFLMLQGKKYNIPSLLSSLYELQMENRQLESELAEVTSRRKQLQMMNQHLSIPLSQTSAAAVATGGHGHNAAVAASTSASSGAVHVTGNPQSHVAANAAATSIVCPTGSIAVASAPNSMSAGGAAASALAIHAPHTNTVNAGTSTNNNIDSISIADTPIPTSNTAAIDGMHPGTVGAPALSQNSQVLGRSKMGGAGGRGSASLTSSSMNPTTSSDDLIPSSFLLGAKNVNEQDTSQAVTAIAAGLIPYDCHSTPTLRLNNGGSNGGASSHNPNSSNRRTPMTPLQSPISTNPSSMSAVAPSLCISPKDNQSLSISSTGGGVTPNSGVTAGSLGVTTPSSVVTASLVQQQQQQMVAAQQLAAAAQVSYLDPSTYSLLAQQQLVAYHRALSISQNTSPQNTAQPATSPVVDQLTQSYRLAAAAAVSGLDSTTPVILNPAVLNSLFTVGPAAR